MQVHCTAGFIILFLPHALFTRQHTCFSLLPLLSRYTIPFPVIRNPILRGQWPMGLR